MRPLVALAPAKVNLVLAVGKPRPRDGMHPVVSLVQTLSLADELRLEPGEGRDTVHCPGVEGPNLAAAALAAYREATGWDGPPVRLTIEKRVPVAAGMGGGSSDAAAALRLVAAAAGRPEDPALLPLAARLGSDVPALLLGGRTLGTGAGESVTPAPAPTDAAAEEEPLGVLVLPSGAQLSTPAVYAEFDRLGLGRDALPDPDRLPPIGTNDLAPAARSLEPSIDAALAAVRTAGADVAVVSGSGPTVVGLFTGSEGPARARRAASGVPGALAATAVGPEHGRPR